MIRAISNSIFTKLLLILTATALFVNFVVFTGIHHFFGPKHGEFDKIRKNIDQYANYLVRDLGEPPSFPRAKALSSELGLDIRFEDAKGQGWTTAENMAHPSEAERGARPPGPPPRRPFLFFLGPPQKPRDHYFVTHTRNGTFVIRGPTPPSMETQVEAIVSLLSILTLIVAVCYASIRRILRPIGGLASAVAELAHGNLDHRVVVDRGDELGRLGQSFNEMTARLKSLISAKEQLLLDVSHELRSPVTRAKLSLEFVPESEPKHEIADELREMDRMIEHLLETARLGSDHGGLALAQVDVGALAREVALKYPTARILTMDDSLVALVDEDRMRRVVTNVIENAIKYSPPGRNVELSGSDRGANLEIAVRDYGVGIPTAEIEQVFEPFYRVDKSRNRKTGGYGLGLSLCRKIMQAHGGEIRLTSVEGEGTTATLVIPKHHLGI